MKLSDDLVYRGLIKDKTFADSAWLDEPKKFYLGIDASSDSLTIGNLAILMLASRLMKAGWQAVLLAGGATSLIGDPGGKEEERSLKDREEIAYNIEGVKSQIEKVLEDQPHELVNNLDWVGDYKYLDFLRDVGKHYSMTELMQRDFVTERMGEGGSGISYAEFSYSLIQGYDFWWLFKNKDVVLQIGASDQWGNMLSGVPLIRKKEGQEVHAFSMPLVINKVTGRKFGKSEDGAIWLDPKKTSPFKFYQFWFNVSDSEVIEYLKIFTFASQEEIESLEQELKSNPEKRQAQKNLADMVTEVVHGKEQTDKVRNATNVIVGWTNAGDVSETILQVLREEVPSLTIESQGSIVDALVNSNLASSNSDARRLLASGAVYINGQKAERENFEHSDFQNGRLLLRRGKAFKDSALVELI